MSAPAFGVLPARSVVVTDPELAEIMAAVLAKYITRQHDAAGEQSIDPRLYAVMRALQTLGSDQVPIEVPNDDSDAPDTSGWLSTKQTAELVGGVSESCVTRKARRRRIRAVLRNGAWLFDPSSAEEWRMERQARVAS